MQPQILSLMREIESDDECPKLFESLEGLDDGQIHASLKMNQKYSDFDVLDESPIEAFSYRHSSNLSHDDSKKQSTQSQSFRLDFTKNSYFNGYNGMNGTPPKSLAIPSLPLSNPKQSSTHHRLRHASCKPSQTSTSPTSLTSPKQSPSPLKEDRHEIRKLKRRSRKDGKDGKDGKDYRANQTSSRRPPSPINLPFLPYCLVCEMQITMNPHTVKNSSNLAPLLYCSEECRIKDADSIPTIPNLQLLSASSNSSSFSQSIRSMSIQSLDPDLTPKLKAKVGQEGFECHSLDCSRPYTQPTHPLQSPGLIPEGPGNESELDSGDVDPTMLDISNLSLSPTLYESYDNRNNHFSSKMLPGNSSTGPMPPRSASPSSHRHSVYIRTGWRMSSPSSASYSPASPYTNSYNNSPRSINLVVPSTVETTSTPTFVYASPIIKDDKSAMKKLFNFLND